MWKTNEKRRGRQVPVNEMQPVAPVPYTGAAPLAPVQVVAQESLPLPTMQAYTHPAGSIMRVQLADGRILDVQVPPGTPPGRQIHFPVTAAPPQLAPAPQQPNLPVAVAEPIPQGQQPPSAPAPQPPMARAGVPAMPPPPPVYAPETVTIQLPPGTMPGTVFRIKLTDGRDLDVTVPAGVQPGCTLTIAVPPRPVDRDGRPLGNTGREPSPLSDCLYFIICLPTAVICCMMCQPQEASAALKFASNNH